MATKPAPNTASTPTVVTATELAKNLSDILNRVKYKGERCEVRRNGETVALFGSMTSSQCLATTQPLSPQSPFRNSWSAASLPHRPSPDAPQGVRRHRDRADHRASL